MAWKAICAALVLFSAVAPAAAQRVAEFKDCADCPEMVMIPAGSFLMGSVPSARSGDKAFKPAADEQPQHSVRIKAFAIGKFEVTQAQWQTIMGDNPSVNKGANLPVDSVSWDDTQIFIQRLNAKTGKRYRLPTEAEWEYAARGGTSTAYSFGDDGGMLDQYGWYEANSGGKSHPVGEKLPNKFGLHDMHGNVWEWVQDCYKPGYAGAPGDGSAVTVAQGCERVDRGGAWQSGPNNLRSGNRDWGPPSYRLNNLGFRLARAVP
jgi:formylglycine-generating enzyme required for sulfatase activity